MQVPAAARLIRPAPGTIRFAWLGLLYLTQGLAPAFVAFALPVLLRREGLSLEATGLTTLLFWPAALRFLIGPLVDRLQSGPGRRWLVMELAAALALLTALLLLVQPASPSPGLFGLLAMLVLGSVVLDVAVGGLTLRLVAPEERRLASALQYGGYYAGTILAGGAFLTVEARAGWGPAVLMLTSLACLGALAAVMLRREAPRFGHVAPGRWRDFLPTRSLLPVLLVSLLIDLPQNAGIALTGPALFDTGLSQDQTALLTGGGGLAAAIGGALAAGLVGRRYRAGAVLLVLALLQAAALLPLALITGIEQLDPATAALAVILAYATAAAFNVGLLAWCMDQAKLRKAATDLALLASVHSISYVVAGPVAGWVAGSIGFPGLFAGSAVAAAALALTLSPLMLKWKRR